MLRRVRFLERGASFVEYGAVVLLVGVVVAVAVSAVPSRVGDLVSHSVGCVVLQEECDGPTDSDVSPSPETGGDPTETTPPDHSVSFPDEDALQDPADVNDWWEELDEAERATVAEQAPERIRNLDGIPSDVRDELNRDFLSEEVDNLLKDEGLARGEVLDSGEDGAASPELRALARLEETLDDGEEDHYLLALDPEEERSIVSNGNPDTADNVATSVPGAGTEWTGINGQLGRADNLQQMAEMADRDADHAVVAWIGYDAPGFLGALGSGAAEDGKDELQRFQTGLRATHEDDEPSNNTVVGHSYGSTVTGWAAQNEPGLPVDELVLVGSPGVGGRLEDLGFDSGDVHVTRSDDDWIEITPDFVHGPDPYGEDFGATRFGSDPGTSHSQYFNNPESEQGQYMGEVIAGQR